LRQAGTPAYNPLARRAAGRGYPWRRTGLFLLTSRFLLELGYLHYEVSNFAREEE
jgi:coproporphyrinogen III oxidase-like Fe-S oxidoreductase